MIYKAAGMNDTQVSTAAAEKHTNAHTHTHAHTNLNSNMLIRQIKVNKMMSERIKSPLIRVRLKKCSVCSLKDVSFGRDLKRHRESIFQRRYRAVESFGRRGGGQAVQPGQWKTKT